MKWKWNELALMAIEAVALIVAYQFLMPVLGESSAREFFAWLVFLWVAHHALR